MMKREQDRDSSQYPQNTYQKSCLKITITARFWYFGKKELKCGRKDCVYLKIYYYFETHLKATGDFTSSRDNFNRIIYTLTLQMTSEVKVQKE